MKNKTPFITQFSQNTPNWIIVLKNIAIFMAVFYFGRMIDFEIQAMGRKMGDGKPVVMLFRNFPFVVIMALIMPWNFWKPAKKPLLYYVAQFVIPVFLSFSTVAIINQRYHLNFRNSNDLIWVLSLGLIVGLIYGLIEVAIEKHKRRILLENRDSAKRVSKALENYFAIHQDYPMRLDELEPGYLDELPATGFDQKSLNDRHQIFSEQTFSYFRLEPELNDGKPAYLLAILNQRENYLYLPGITETDFLKVGLICLNPGVKVVDPEYYKKLVKVTA